METCQLLQQAYGEDAMGRKQGQSGYFLNKPRFVICGLSVCTIFSHIIS